MEQGKFDLNKLDLPGNFDSRSVPHTILSLEKSTQQHFFSEAVQLGGDWLEATGGQSITTDQYNRLFERGYVSYPSTNVLDIFYDWEDYQQMSRVFFSDLQKERKLKDSRMLKHIKCEVSEGLIPEILTKKVEQYTENNAQKNTHKRKSILYRYRITDEPAEPQIILERYAKYKLAKYLVQDRPSGNDISSERLSGIAMGFNPASGKSLSSFLGSVKNSHPFLNQVDVEWAAEELGLYEYVYPDTRKSHLEHIYKNGTQDIPTKLGQVGLIGQIERSLL